MQYGIGLDYNRTRDNFMIKNSYIENSEYITKIEKRSETYLQIDTGFDKCQIFLSDNLYSEKENLLRFIDTDLYDYYNDDVTLGVYYLPTHAMNILVDKIGDNIFDSCLQEYLPTNNNEKFRFDRELDNQEVILHRNRSRHATSFFMFNTPERIDEIISVLKCNIASLRDYDAAVGSVPENYGVLEITNHEKTKDPQSFHCSFWKFNTTSLNNLGKNFVKVG